MIALLAEAGLQTGTASAVGALVLVNGALLTKLLRDGKKNCAPGTGSVCRKHGENIARASTRIEDTIVNVDRRLTTIEDDVKTLLGKTRSK